MTPPLTTMKEKPTQYRLRTPPVPTTQTTGTNNPYFAETVHVEVFVAPPLGLGRGKKNAVSFIVGITECDTAPPRS